jgi:hypothetical protein
MRFNVGPFLSEEANTIEHVFDQTVFAEWPDEPGEFIDADWPVRMAEGCGPTGEALDLLAGATPDGLSEQARISALAQLTAIAAHLESVRATFTAAVAGPAPDDPREDWGVHEVAVASRSSVYAADRQVAFSRDLACRLTATRAALEAGRISFAQARMLSESVAHLDDDIAQQIEEKMLRFAYRQDLTLFKAALKRWLARLDPQFTTRAKAARREVLVEHTDLGDGVGELSIRGPLEKIAAIDVALTAYSTASKPLLGGSASSRKLSGLVQWAEDYLTSPGAPRRHGRAYGVQVVVDTPSLFGLASHPAEVLGYGFIPAEAAVELLANGSPLRRLITDPDDGRLLHYGTRTYIVPPPLADHLVALHQRSAGPHSNVPAAYSDLDHNVPHGEGGPTDPDNVTPLDRRWHRAKTHAGWTYTKNEDGSITWTSPCGQMHRVDPHDYRLGP